LVSAWFFFIFFTQSLEKSLVIFFKLPQNIKEDKEMREQKEKKGKKRSKRLATCCCCPISSRLNVQV